MGDIDALDSDGIGTGEPPRAVAIGGANAATKGALVAIVNANIVDAANSLAVGGRRTGLAEIGMLGDADEDQVRVGGSHLFAGPAGGTVFLAGLGANAIAQILNAPAGLAVAVFGTRFEEAALAIAERGHVRGQVQ